MSGSPGARQPRDRRSQRGKSACRLERHAVSHDARIVEFCDNSVRHIPRAFTRSPTTARCPRTRVRDSTARAKRPGVMRSDAKAVSARHPTLAPASASTWELRVIDFGRLHRLTGRDDLVAVERIATIGFRQTGAGFRNTDSRRALPCRGLVSCRPRRSTVSPAVISVPANEMPLRLLQPWRFGARARARAPRRIRPSQLRRRHANHAAVAMDTAMPG